MNWIVIAQKGFDNWAAKPHNAKWFRRIDGTPIPNDLVVCIGEAFVPFLAPVPAVAVKEWRCFHCDEVFTDERCARDHFGRDETCEPACQIKMGAERSLLSALRRAEDDCNEMMQRMLSESTDSAKAYYAQTSRHQQQLRTIEELGYERALRDAADLVGTAIADIAAERQRQIDAEGWTPEHDDDHDTGEMAQAAACYLIHDLFLGTWPWDLVWFKPTDRRRDLVKAGALIIAEIERLDRAAAKVPA